jgi:cysteine desulfurase/selenocysteine lyase
MSRHSPPSSGGGARRFHHCAQLLTDRLGVTATCRASFAMWHTKASVDALVEALVKAHECPCVKRGDW